MIVMPTPGNVTKLDACEQILAGRVLRPIHDHEIRGPPDLDQTLFELARPRRVAGRETERLRGAHVTEAREHRDHPQDPERLRTGARRSVRSENHAIELTELARRGQREQRGAAVTVVHDLDRARARFAQADDLIVRQRRVPAVDVTDHVRVRFEHDVLVDEPGTRDRRAARVNRALDPVLARPRDHPLCLRARFHGAEPDLAEQLHTRFREIAEIRLDHALFDHRRAREHLHAGRPQVVEPPLRGNRHRFQSDDVLRSAGHVHLARGNHRRDAAVQRAVDPVQLALARRPVARDGMHVAVDEPRCEHGARGVDGHGRAVRIAILRAPDRRDAPVDGDDCVRVQDRCFEGAGQHEPDVAYHELPGCCRVVVHTRLPCRSFVHEWSGSGVRIATG